MAQKVRISLNLSKTNDSQLATLAAAVIKGITGNKAFPNPPVDPTAVQTALDDFNAALAAMPLGGVPVTAAKNNKRDVLVGLLQKIGYYVQTHCNGDREILVSSGFAELPPRGAASVPAKPSILSVDNGNTTELVVKAAGVGRVRCYEMRYASVGAGGAPGPWQPAGLFTDVRSISVTGLTPGNSYAFQVRAMATAGFSEWSDPVVHVCW